MNSINLSYCSFHITVPIIVTSGKRRIKINALLDDGITKSYLNADVAAELGLNRETSKISDGISQFESAPVTIGIESLNGQIKKNVDVQTMKNCNTNSKK